MIVMSLACSLCQPYTQVCVVTQCFCVPDTGAHQIATLPHGNFCISRLSFTARAVYLIFRKYKTWIAVHMSQSKSIVKKNKTKQNSTDIMEDTFIFHNH